MKVSSIIPEYIELLPPVLQDGKLYISNKYGTAIHRCCCGCGTKIVTPLKPTDWTLTERNGRVSLSPSVGNWNHPCQSHYIIRNNRVIEAGRMTKREILRGRAMNEIAKESYTRDSQPTQTRQDGWLSILKRWFDKITG